MAMSMSAVGPNAAVYHRPRRDLWAANANEPDAPPPSALGQTSPYRAAGLYQGRGLAWPAWTAALALHGALALIAIALGWTSVPPSPLPETITVVFEPAPAPAVEPAAPAVQPTARAMPEPSPSEPPPRAQPALSAEPAPTSVAVLPLPPPARPRPEPMMQAPSLPATPPAPVEPAAPAANAAPLPQAAAVPTSLAALPVLPPRPATGMAGNRKPVYPLVARSRHLEGRVMLQVEVAASGDPLTVRVISSSGHEMLDVAAVDAVRTWRFVPATRAGQPVAGSVDVPVDFRMMD